MPLHPFFPLYDCSVSSRRVPIPTLILARRSQPSPQAPPSLTWKMHLKRVVCCMRKMFISLVHSEDEIKVSYIPVVVAVVSPFPPSDKIGIKSVQRETEEIIPMKQMKLDWVPYIPLENRESQVDRLKSQIFILSCTQRVLLKFSGSSKQSSRSGPGSSSRGMGPIENPENTVAEGVQYPDMGGVGSASARAWELITSLKIVARQEEEEPRAWP